MQRDQSVSEMAEEVLMRQAKDLAHRSGRSLEDARQGVSDTEAGRQLKDLANGEHRHEKAKNWQVGVFWDRVEERWMHQAGSKALSRFAAERHYFEEPKVSAPRVLIAIQPWMYAEVLAFSVGRERPTAEVSILDPSSEGLEEAALRLLPHLVVANRGPKTAGEGWPHFFFWVEVDEVHAGDGTEKRLGARISADGHSQSVEEVRIEHVLLALDRAEEELVWQERSRRAQGSGSESP
jgi:hypothetical protein